MRKLAEAGGVSDRAAPLDAAAAHTASEATPRRVLQLASGVHVSAVQLLGLRVDAAAAC